MFLCLPRRNNTRKRRSNLTNTSTTTSPPRTKKSTITRRLPTTTKRNSSLHHLNKIVMSTRNTPHYTITALNKRPPTRGELFRQRRLSNNETNLIRHTRPKRHHPRAGRPTMMVRGTIRLFNPIPIRPIRNQTKTMTITLPLLNTNGLLTHLPRERTRTN